MALNEGKAFLEALGKVKSESQDKALAYLAATQTFSNAAQALQMETLRAAVEKTKADEQEKAQKDFVSKQDKLKEDFPNGKTIQCIGVSEEGCPDNANLIVSLRILLDQLRKEDERSFTLPSRCLHCNDTVRGNVKYWQKKRGSTDDEPSTEDKAKADECAKRARIWKSRDQPAEEPPSPSQVKVPPSSAFPTPPNTKPVLPIDSNTGNFTPAPKGPTPYTNSRANLGNPVLKLGNQFANLKSDDEDEKSGGQAD